MSENNSENMESDGFVSLEMPIKYYEDNLELFSEIEDIKLKSAYRKQKAHANDEVYKEKLKAFIEAKNDLLEYEVSMRYKQLIKI